MLDAIRSEQYKTRHTKIFTILCVGALVLGVITVYMNHSMYMAGKIKELSGENALKSGMSNISVVVYKYFQRENEKFISYLNMYFNIVFLTCELYVIAYVYGVRLTISSIILAEIVIGAAVGIKILKRR